MRVLILGRFEVGRGGATLDLGPRLQRAVLARLVLDAGRIVSAEALIEDLWGARPPAKALASVQAYVANLRRVLEPDRPARTAASILRTQAPGYLLDLSGHTLDADEFEHHAAAVHALLAQGRAVRAREAADAALALWRGPTLDDLSDLRFAQDAATRLDALRAAVMEDRLEALVESGEHAAAVGQLRGLTREHPLRERGWALLMLALYRAGRAAEALDVYREVAGLLSEELGLDPGNDLRRLQEQILRRDPALDAAATADVAAVGDALAAPTGPAAPDAPAGRAAGAAPDAPAAPQAPAASLPPDPATELVGRDGDVAAVAGLIETTRAVTILGPGGVGKTRLAVRVAHLVAARFPGGAHFVDLAPLGDADLVLPAVARVLGARERSEGVAVADVLLEVLGDRRALLVLDNVEHVIAAAPDIAMLVEHAPGVRVLATSRAALRVRGERQYLLAPLDLPDLDRIPTAGDLAASPAARLFVDRATAVDAGFTLSDDNASAVAAICRRLDGLPLALELAAPWVRTLSPTDLLARLGDALPLLSHGPRDLPERQRTMRETVAWSYDLLEDAERRLLQDLAVFRGGWALDGAEAVASDPAATLTAHAGLQEKSLIRRLPPRRAATAPRFRMLETIRAFALERLDAQGHLAAARDRHGAHYLAAAERMSPALEAHGQQDALQWASTELDNLRAAVDWLLSSDRAEDAVRLLWALRWYWYITGTVREPRGWVRAAHRAADRMAPAVRARALVLEAFIEYAVGEWAAAAQIMRRLDTLLDDLHNPPLAAFASQVGAQIAIGAGDLRGARALALDAAERCRGLDDPCGEGIALLSVVHADLASGRHDAVPELLTRAEALVRRSGAAWMIAYALNMRIGFAEARGTVTAEVERIRESIRLCHRIGDRIAVAYGMSSMAGVLVALDRPGDAVRLMGAAATVRAHSGLAVPNEVTRAQMQRDADRARAQLGDHGFTRCWADGRALRIDDAVQLALRASAPAHPG
ncbi:MAG TPA: BTAD domain-containing putative transcriptional regulator [Euzebyales bacterium]|nr:BTAD domain-containing putative transcriptional regulator [Euzebyales bacterium]